MCEKLALDRAARFPLFTILSSPLLRSCFVRHFNYIIRQLAITHCRKPKIISIFLVYLSSYFLCLFLSPNTQHTNSSAPHNFPACFFADLNSDLQKLSYAGPRARTAWKTNHQTVFYICNLFSRLRNSFSYFFSRSQTHNFYLKIEWSEFRIFFFLLFSSAICQLNNWRVIANETCSRKFN